MDGSKRLRRAGMALLLTVVICTTTMMRAQAVGAEGVDPALEQQVTKLVEQLGAATFAERENATEQLVLVGILAEAHLREALKSPSREVRLRSKRVLDVILENDFANRLRAFEADEDAEGGEYGFPNWSRFHEIVGKGESAKSLFLEMYEVERDLLEADIESSDVATAALSRRCRELREVNQLTKLQNPVPRIAALMFVATNKEARIDREMTAGVFELTQQPDFFRTMMGDPDQPRHQALEKLLSRWILRKDNLPASGPLMMGMQYNVAKSVERARDVLADPQAMLYDRFYAVFNVAKFGDEEDIPRLEELLEDASFLKRYQAENRLFDVQLRDVALAGLLCLTGSNPLDFGYDRLRIEGLYALREETLGFANDDLRQAAIEKWRSRDTE